MKIFSRPAVRWGCLALGGPLAALILIQLLPVWLLQTNPAARTEPAWDSPQTRALAVRACFDCHSNATVWPWYSRVAPVSWLVTRDVVSGRRHLNFSDWKPASLGRLENDPAQLVTEGQMPPDFYVMLHPNAALNAAERRQLADGLQQTLGAP